MAREPMLLLLDNGSLEPAATLNLRRLANGVSACLARTVHPVSLLHSHKVPATELEGQPAEILIPFLRRQLSAGREDFIIIPLFFGPSGAIADYVPEKIAELRLTHPALRVKIAPCLVPIPEKPDARIIQILADNLLPLLRTCSTPPKVVLVDHGSPKPLVTSVRDALALNLANHLGTRVTSVRPASMERRPEPEYDFNNPLLEKLLEDPLFASGEIMVSLLFLSPGRHAGPGGDIDRICETAMAKNPRLHTTMTPLVGSHPLLIKILADRARQALEQEQIP